MKLDLSYVCGEDCGMNEVGDVDGDTLTVAPLPLPHAPRQLYY